MKPHNENNFNYYYSREERLNMPNAPKINSDKSKNIFKKNKSLAIILIDIIIFLIVFSVIKLFLETPSFMDNNSGYLLTLSGFSTNEEVIVRIRIEKKENTVTEGTADIIFKAGSNSLELKNELPDNKGEVIEITDSIKVSSKTNLIKAVVVIGTEKSELSLDLSKN